MQSNPFVDYVLNKFDRLKAQFKAKNDQYATADPVANFRTGALLRYRKCEPEDMYEVAKEYMGKHVAHVYNNGAHGPKVDESLADIAIYCLIMLYFVKKAKKEPDDWAADAVKYFVGGYPHADK